MIRRNDTQAGKELILPTVQLEDRGQEPSHALIVIGHDRPQASSLTVQAQLVSEHQGKERDPVVMNTIAELITYAEMLRMSLDYACRHFEQSPSGMVFPNVLAINAAKYFYAANFHETVRHLHDLRGDPRLQEHFRH